MNNIKDFLKVPNGTVLNTNAQDFVKARNRNQFFKKSKEVIGDGVNEGVVDKLKKDLKKEHSKVLKLTRDMNTLKKLVESMIKNKEVE